MALIALCPDELSVAAEAALVFYLLEIDDDPNGWTVRNLWASVDDEPVYALVLVNGRGEIRAFTVGTRNGEPMIG